MNTFYQIAVSIIALLLYPLGRLHPRFKIKIKQRFGQWNAPAGKYFWVHGASVGEIQGMIPLIEEIKKNYPGELILGTATSVKGLELLEKHVTVARLLTIDSELFIRPALKNITIRKFIFGETEIWPALLSYLKKNDIPTVMLNARLSEMNFKTYQKISFFISAALLNIDRIYAIDPENADRFMKLGVAADKIKVRGNLKYDRRPKVASIAEAARLKETFFRKNAKVVVLGNIRPGEECFWLDNIKKYEDRFKFIVAPRHSEKFDYFAQCLSKNNISFDKASELKNGSDSAVVLLDIFGQLEDCYSFASLTFVGGTLLPQFGGHSPMEAAAYSNALLIGPHFLNQRDCVLELKNKSAIKIVTTAG